MVQDEAEKNFATSNGLPQRPLGIKRIMGIDPGSQKTGWGLVSLCMKTGKMAHIDNGVIMLDKGEPLVERLVFQALHYTTDWTLLRRQLMMLI